MERKIKTVVIGTSLTEMSDPVVRAGLAVARAAGAKVLLVHAFQPYVSIGGGAPYVPDMFLEEAIRTERKVIAARMEEQAVRLGLREEETAGRRIELGAPHRVLIEIADASSADLLVVGSAESPLRAKVFGSTADRVVRKSLRPVLIVRDGFEVPPRKVLLPVDLSPVSAEAFRRGMDVLSQIAQPSLSLEALYVLPVQDPGLFDVGKAPEQTEEQAARELGRFVARNGFLSPHRVETRVVRGEVEEVIRARGDEWGADLIVLGTHGRGGFERFLLGSVASDVVRRGSASVLVIPPVVAVEQERPVLRAEAVAVMAFA
jgi:nucleotide-binding universal stress UspA family protein